MILALDLDDTLLRSDKRVGAASAAALGRWLASGHEVIVATGRPPRWVEGVLPAEVPAGPRIVYNGAQVVAGGQVLYRNELAPADVRLIVDWAREHRPHWPVGLEIDDTLYVDRPFKPGESILVEDLGALCDRPAAKLIFPFAERCDDLEDLLAMLPVSVRALVTPKFHLVQLCGRTTDKADALAYLLAQRGLSFADVVAIGDDVNDVEMVRRAHIGVAVDNALDAVKAVADWVTAANNEDGVAQALERILAAQAVAG